MISNAKRTSRPRAIVELRPAGHSAARTTDSTVVELIPALRAFSRSFVHNRSDADDLVQETLIKALGNIHLFQPGTNMRSWLFTIMRNAFYTRIRISRREMPGALDCVASQPATDPTQEWSMRGREIGEAMERLPLQHREIIMLIGVLGVSYEDAAQVCCCAVGTVKSRLNRARAGLLAELGETSFEASVEQTVPHPVASLVSDGARKAGGSFRS